MAPAMSTAAQPQYQSCDGAGLETTTTTTASTLSSDHNTTTATDKNRVREDKKEEVCDDDDDIASVELISVSSSRRRELLNAHSRRRTSSAPSSAPEDEHKDETSPLLGGSGKSSNHAAISSTIIPDVDDGCEIIDTVVVSRPSRGRSSSRSTGSSSFSSSHRSRRRRARNVSKSPPSRGSLPDMTFMGMRTTKKRKTSLLGPSVTWLAKAVMVTMSLSILLLVATERVVLFPTREEREMAADYDLKSHIVWAAAQIRAAQRLADESRRGPHNWDMQGIDVSSSVPLEDQDLTQRRARRAEELTTTSASAGAGLTTAYMTDPSEPIGFQKVLKQLRPHHKHDDGDGDHHHHHRHSRKSDKRDKEGNKIPHPPAGCEATVLLVRHCEKGNLREHCAYVGYERSVYLAGLFGDDANSRWPTPALIYALGPKRKHNTRKMNFREIETVGPISAKTGVAVNYEYDETTINRLATEIWTLLETGQVCGKVVLVSWKHSGIGHLARRLGCGPLQGCPVDYRGRSFDDAWQLKYVYREEDDHAAKKSLSRHRHRGDFPWHVFGSVQAEGFDPLAFSKTVGDYPPQGTHVGGRWKKKAIDVPDLELSRVKGSENSWPEKLENLGMTLTTGSSVASATTEGSVADKDVPDDASTGTHHKHKHKNKDKHHDSQP